MAAGDRRVGVVLAARDEASKVFQNFSDKTLPNLAKSVAGLAVGFASVGAALDVIKEAGNNALEAEVATAALSAALDSQKISVQANLPHLTAYAGAMSRLTKATDEEIEGVQKTLIQIGRLSGGVLDRATKSSLDLAAGLGIDLASAGDRVAKAAAGNVREWTRLGVKFQENASDAEKLDTVLKFIDQRFGGAAQAQVQTMSGKIGLLTKAYGELLESVGKQALGGVGKTNIIDELTDSLNVLAKRVEDNGLIGALRDVQKIMDDFNLFGIGTPNLNKFLNDITNLKMDDATEAALSGKFAADADPILAAYTKHLDEIIQGQEDAAASAKKWKEQLAKIVENIEVQTFAPVARQPKAPITGDAEPFVLKQLVDETEEIARQNAEWQKMVALIANAHDGLIGFGEEITVSEVNANALADAMEAAVGSAMTTAAVQLGDAMIDAAFGTKQSWGETLEAILKGILKAILQAYILKAIESVGFFGSGGVAGGYQGASMMSGGGIAGRSTLYAAAGMFTPRGTDTLPAMLTPGEGILTRGDTHSVLGGRAKIVPAGSDEGRAIYLTVNAMDGPSFGRFLQQNPRALADALDHLEARGYR